MRIIDKIAWIELKDGKVLSARSKGKDRFFLPGGKREPGESDEETLVREVREELSVEINPESIEWVGKFTDQAYGHEEGIEVIMSCYKASFTGELKESHEIEEMAWLNSWDTDKISHVDKKIFKFLHDRGELE
ncbi:MAG: NUDIX domain-containing protein [Bacteroidota bacterium]